MLKNCPTILYNSDTIILSHSQADKVCGVSTRSPLYAGSRDDTAGCWYCLVTEMEPDIGSRKARRARRKGKTVYRQSVKVRRCTDSQCRQCTHLEPLDSGH